MSHFTDAQRIEQEKELMRQQDANALKNSGAGTFSRPHTSSITHLGNRGFHEQTPVSATRRAEMQQPVKPQVQFPQVRGMMSSTLSQHQRTKDPITEQADFFHLLETNYHAIRGNYKSYEAAINRYHDDMQRQRAERFASIAKINEEKERRFHSAQKADEERFKQNFQSRHGHQPQQDEERKPGWWQGTFDRAREYARSARSHPYSQQRHEESHARGGPAQGGPARDEPQLGQRRKMPKSKALVIMGFDPTSTPPYDALKKAFNKQALLLHPDKNLANPQEAAVKFKRMRKAFNSLIDKGTSDTDTDAEGGGIIKRRHKRHKTSKKARRNTRRNTHRKSHRKSNKRR